MENLKETHTHTHRMLIVKAWFLSFMAPTEASGQLHAHSYLTQT